MIMSKKSDVDIAKSKLDKMIALLEHLVAVQLYRGGATQPEIASNLGFSVGKVNSLVKGVKTRKESHGKEK
jgi:DNA-binding transcriptional regulator LsrR (DeoR family)